MSEEIIWSRKYYQSLVKDAVKYKKRLKKYTSKYNKDILEVPTATGDMWADIPINWKVLHVRIQGLRGLAKSLTGRNRIDRIDRKMKGVS